MAINEIQVGRFNGLLHKLLAMKEASPAPTLAPDILPVLALEADRIEWKFLGGERLCWGWDAVAALAANFSLIQFANLAGSGILIVLEEIWVRSLSADDVRVDTTEASAVELLGTLRTTQKGPRDLRQGVTEVGIAGQIRDRQDVANAIVNPRFLFRLELARMNLLPLGGGLVLPPNRTLVLQMASVNTSIAAAFMWRERTIEPSEER